MRAFYLSVFLTLFTGNCLFSQDSLSRVKPRRWSFEILHGVNYSRVLNKSPLSGETNSLGDKTSILNLATDNWLLHFPTFKALVSYNYNSSISTFLGLRVCSSNLFMNYTADGTDAQNRYFEDRVQSNIKIHSLILSTGPTFHMDHIFISPSFNWNALLTKENMYGTHWTQSAGHGGASYQNLNDYSSSYSCLGAGVTIGYERRRTAHSFIIELASDYYPYELSVYTLGSITVHSSNTAILLGFRF